MSETLTQRLAPMLERFDVVEWGDGEVKLSLRGSLLEVDTNSDYVSGPHGGGIRQTIWARLHVCSSRKTSLNDAALELRERLAEELALIDDYLEWARGADAVSKEDDDGRP
jgi:hypothetical protein